MSGIKERNISFPNECSIGFSPFVNPHFNLKDDIIIIVWKSNT